MTVRPIDLQSNPPSVQVFESTLFLHSKEDCPFLSRVLMGGRLFEPFETHLLRREIRPGDVVLDIGANIGYYTIQFAHLVGARGKVVAFEPDSVNFNLLEQSVKANRLSNIELVNAAISNRRGRQVLHRSRKIPGIITSLIVEKIGIRSKLKSQPLMIFSLGGTPGWTL